MREAWRSLRYQPAVGAALGALLAMALTVSVNAKQDDKAEKDKKDKVEVVDAIPDTNSGKPYSVPDTGSTIAFLAFSVALLALSQRKIARAQ